MSASEEIDLWAKTTDSYNPLFYSCAEDAPDDGGEREHDDDAVQEAPGNVLVIATFPPGAVFISVKFFQLIKDLSLENRYNKGDNRKHYLNHQ